MVMVYLNQWARFEFCNLYVIEMNQENRNYYNCGSFEYLARNCRSRRIRGRICHIQVHLSGNNIPTVKPLLNHTSPPFLQHVLWRCCNPLGIPSSMAGILLFNSVFYDRVTPVSVSTLKSLLRAIGVLLLKSQASPIISVCI